MLSWATWEEFKSLQQEIKPLAGTVAHIPVTIRCIDAGQDFKGTILLMHGIPTWGYLYHAVIPGVVQARDDTFDWKLKPQSSAK